MSVQPDSLEEAVAALVASVGGATKATKARPRHWVDHGMKHGALMKIVERAPRT